MTRRYTIADVEESDDQNDKIRLSQKMLEETSKKIDKYIAEDNIILAAIERVISHCETTIPRMKVMKNAINEEEDRSYEDSYDYYCCDATAATLVSEYYEEEIVTEDDDSLSVLQPQDLSTSLSFATNSRTSGNDAPSSQYCEEEIIDDNEEENSLSVLRPQDLYSTSESSYYYEDPSTCSSSTKTTRTATSSMMASMIFDQYKQEQKQRNKQTDFIRNIAAVREERVRLMLSDIKTNSRKFRSNRSI